MTANYPFRVQVDEFQDKWVLVTGGTKGIGEAIARRFTLGGAPVATTARSPLPQDQSPAVFVQADIGTAAGAQAVIDRIQQEWSGLDILINSAGGSDAPNGGFQVLDRLVATARDPRRLADLVQKYGDQVRTAPLDVADEDAANAAVQVAVDTFGRLDVVVNNAGYGDELARSSDAAGVERSVLVGLIPGRFTPPDIRSTVKCWSYRQIAHLTGT